MLTPDEIDKARRIACYPAEHSLEPELLRGAFFALKAARGQPVTPARQLKLRSAHIIEHGPDHVRSLDEIHADAAVKARRAAWRRGFCPTGGDAA